MNKFRLNINGKEVTGLPGQTILEVARENDIFIPTLCYDERTKIYGSCGICMCEVEGNPKLCKACATGDRTRNGDKNKYTESYRIEKDESRAAAFKSRRRLQTAVRTGMSCSDRLSDMWDSSPTANMKRLLSW